LSAECGARLALHQAQPAASSARPFSWGAPTQQAPPVRPYLRPASSALQAGAPHHAADLQGLGYSAWQDSVCKAQNGLKENLADLDLISTLDEYARSPLGLAQVVKGQPGEAAVGRVLDDLGCLEG
jgi:hypothetical protein